MVITDLGLNEFRKGLLGYMQENGDLSRLPNGLHTVVPARPDKGLYLGVIFTLRNLNLTRTLPDGHIPDLTITHALGDLPEPDFAHRFC
ncbi:hypothetical protein [Halomonas sp. 11-S5]|uniref:hypothetical protein n=1 Tax=Halomonas sp. 11-S5 TaxID=2994064 RepID=UPI0024690D0F|nr:hypothetical protein [Halomonas sp. 11-S5]